MKILVTGANGQVGGAILRAAPVGCEVIGLTRSEMDLSQPDGVAQVIAQHRPDWVINAAAYTAVDRAESEPDLAATINASAVHAIVSAQLVHGGRLLQISTDYVFDGEKLGAYRPRDHRSPISVYGKTKADGEDAAGIDSIVLRVSWVHAAGHDNFVTRMLRLMQQRDRIDVVDDQFGAPAWGHDIARTVWALIDRAPAGVYHHRDAGEISRYGFALAIAEEAQMLGLLDRLPELSPVPSAAFPTAARRPRNSVLDDSETRALLGDRTAHWRDNLRRMLAEEKELG